MTTSGFMNMDVVQDYPRIIDHNFEKIPKKIPEFKFVCSNVKMPESFTALGFIKFSMKDGTIYYAYIYTVIWSGIQQYIGVSLKLSCSHFLKETLKYPVYSTHPIDKYGAGNTLHKAFANAYGGNFHCYSNKIIQPDCTTNPISDYQVCQGRHCIGRDYIPGDNTTGPPYVVVNTHITALNSTANDTVTVPFEEDKWKSEEINGTIQSETDSELIHDRITGRYVGVPDMRNAEGQQIFYDEYSQSIWTEAETLVSYINSDTVRLVESVTIPDIPKYPINIHSSTFILMRRHIIRESIKSQQRMAHLLDDYTYNGQDYSDFQNKPKRRRRSIFDGFIGGVFGKITCAISSIFGGGCGGSNKQAIQEEADAIKETNDAVRKTNGRLELLAKSQDAIRRMTRSALKHTMENSMALKNLSAELVVLAEKSNDGIMNAIRTSIQYTNLIAQFEQFQQQINHQVQLAEQLVQLVSMNGGRFPDVSSIFKHFKGTATFKTHLQRMHDCFFLPSRIFVKRGGLNVVLNFRCPKTNDKYTLYRPTPLIGSHNGKVFTQPRKEVQDMVLMATDSFTKDCGTIETPVGNFDMSVKKVKGMKTGGKCIIHRMLATTDQQLRACSLKTESQIICQKYMVSPYTPDIWPRDEPLFPWSKYDTTYVMSHPPKAVFPFALITGSMAMTLVPSIVYSPPFINHKLPAFYFFTLSAQAGNVIPLSSIYSRTRYASVKLPPASGKVDNQFGSSVVVVISSQHPTGAGRAISEGVSQTTALVKYAQKQNKAFQRAISEQVNNTVSQVEKYANEYNRTMTAVNNMHDDVYDQLDQSDKDANNAKNDAVDGASDDKYSFMKWLNLGLALAADCGVAGVVFFLFQGAAAAPTNTTVHETALSNIMPHVIASMLLAGLVITFTFTVKTACTKKFPAKKFLSMLYLNVIIILFTIQHLSDVIDFTNYHNLFTEKFLLVFCFIMHGSCALLFLVVASFLGNANSFVLPTKHATTVFDIGKELEKKVVEVLSDDADAKRHWFHKYDAVSQQRYAFLAFTVMFFLLVAGLIFYIVTMKRTGIPTTWKATKWMRFKSLFQKMKPIAIQIAGSPVQINTERQQYNYTYFIGWVDCPTKITEVLVPNVHVRGTKAVIAGDLKRKTVKLDHLYEQYSDYSKIRQCICTIDNGRELSIPCDVNTGDFATKSKRNLLKKAAYLRAQDQADSDNRSRPVLSLHPFAQPLGTVNESMEEEQPSNAPSSSSQPELPPLSQVVAGDRFICSDVTFRRLQYYAQHHGIEFPSSKLSFAQHKERYLEKLGYTS